MKLRGSRFSDTKIIACQDKLKFDYPRTSVAGAGLCGIARLVRKASVFRESCDHNGETPKSTSRSGLNQSFETPGAAKTSSGCF